VSRNSANLRHRRRTELAKPADAVAATPPSASNGSLTGTDGAEENVRRRWVIFAVVSMALLMGSIDQTIVATALPRLQHDLHTTVNWSGWTITAYQLGAVLTLPVAGRVADLYGRKKVFMICVVIFTASSLACGLSDSIYMLVPLRAVQAIGGGAFMPSASGIVSESFGKDRDRAIGMFTSIFPLGALIGPVLGGIITQDWSWRGIFLINIPIGILLVILGLRILPGSLPRVAKRPDFAGTALLGVLLISAMYGITTLGSGKESVLSLPFLVPEAVAVIFAVLLSRQMRAAENPIIPIRLLRERHFATMNLIALLYGGTALGFATLVPLYAHDRYHIQIFQAGTVLTARAIGAVAVASITSFLLRKIGYRIPMVVGFALGAAGLELLAVSPHGGLSTYFWLAFGAMVLGLGGGISAPATNNAILSFAPDQVASISGLRGMFRQIGGMITISVTTAIVARSSNEGIALGHAFTIFALVLLLVAIPLVFTVPSRRGTW
jgi:EmrB/QacA subfamily drug resistance transporter